MKNKEINKINIDDIIQKEYIKYASFVIQQRTLPDVRDGLKPVHRRILFAMYKLNNFYNKPFKKSARIVGDVIGKYHPHGDTSVYKSIIKMVQKFLTRYPLIEGQGNFGTIDKDPAAAMRYTEIRLTKIANNLIDDLNISTDFTKNYDESEDIPYILPSKIPNILLNGTTGIAVGMKTNIPPHNLNEVIQACIAYLNNEEIHISELIEFIQGPDFPTGGIIINKKKLKNIYLNGYGILNIQSNISIEKKKIIIHDLPFQVSKTLILNKIFELIKKKKILIDNVIDKSDQNYIKIILEVNKTANIEKTKLDLLQNTKLKINYHINMIALLNKKPKLFNLKEIIIEFINYRRLKIIEKKKKEINLINHDIKKQICFLIINIEIDKIINIIKIKKNIKYELKKINLNQYKSKFNFIDKIININQMYLDDQQINFILKQKLFKINFISIEKLEKKILINKKKIEEIDLILSNKKYLDKIIIKELIFIKNKFSDIRKTKII